MALPFGSNASQTLGDGHSLGRLQFNLRANIENGCWLSLDPATNQWNTIARRIHVSVQEAG